MDDVNILALISRWLHIVAAILLIGGAILVRFAVLPAAASCLSPESQEQLSIALRRRWARLAHVGIALLLLTGIGNFVLLTLPSNVEPMPYHAIFGLKFLGALFVFFLASALVGSSEGLAKMRRESGKWLTVLIVVGVLIVLASGWLAQLRQAQAHTPDEASGQARVVRTAGYA